MTGKCIDGINKFTCDCIAGFSGRLCLNNDNDCDPNPCKVGSCTDLVNDYNVRTLTSDQFLVSCGVYSDCYYKFVYKFIDFYCFNINNSLLLGVRFQHLPRKF